MRTRPTLEVDHGAPHYGSHQHLLRFIVISTQPSPRPGPDTLIVDADAYIISKYGATAVELAGTWSIQINGQVEAFEHHVAAVQIFGTSSDTATVKVGPLGDISNSDGAGGVAFVSQVNTTLFNRGSIATQTFSYAVAITGEAHVTNVGSIIGPVGFGDFADTFQGFSQSQRNAKVRHR